MSRTGITRTLTAVALAAAAVPGTAVAHSGVSMSGDTVGYHDHGLGSENTVVVSLASDGSIEIADPTASGGVSPGPCTPITEHRAQCPPGGIARVVIGVDAEADSVTSQLDLATRMQGGAGNDVLTGGPASDSLVGGSGDDRLSGGDGDDDLSDTIGADALDGGAGNDSLKSTDTSVDTLRCGAGFDTVVADPADVLLDPEECESVQRVTRVASPGDLSVADLTAPALARLRVPARLRLTSRRRFATITWSQSERAVVVFRLRRVRRGHLSRGACRPAPPRRGQRGCLLLRSIGGGFERNGRAGANRARVALSYRGRLFAAGRYRLEARAVDPAGNRSRLLRAGFRVLR